MITTHSNEYLAATKPTAHFNGDREEIHALFMRLAGMGTDTCVFTDARLYMNVDGMVSIDVKREGETVSLNLHNDGRSYITVARS